MVWVIKKYTGVRSRSESASLAEVAASRRSSHLLPWASAESGLLFSMLNLLAKSLDFVFSCFAFRLFCDMEDFLGLAGLSFLWIGGRVDERPGGERAKIDGSSSLGRGD